MRRAFRGDGLAAEILADKPLGYWKLNDPAGIAATDYSGNGRHGVYENSPTKNAPGITPHGARGSALLAAASAQDVSITEVAAFGVTTMTAECLFKLTTGQTLFNRRTAANLGGFSLEAVGGFANIYVSVSLAFAGATIPLAVSAGVPYYVAGRYDGANVMLTLVSLLTGVVTTGTEVAAGTMDNPASPLVLIGKNSVSGLTFDGWISDVAYYGSSLSNGRIAAHYAAALAQ